MSDFNVGDKVYLECEVKQKDVSDNTYVLIYKDWCGGEYETEFAMGDALHPTDEAYNKGLEDAWELAKKIAMPEHLDGYTADEIRNIFGKNSFVPVFANFTPQEALTKVKDYEERNEIKVGDIVDDGFCSVAIVTRVDSSTRTLYILYRDGSCGCHNIKECAKTGKHFDSIDEFVKS